MSTARDLITGSLEILGVLAGGETASAEDMATGLNSLRRMLKSWSTQRLLISVVEDESFTLVDGQSSYTMGTGGDFNTDRPMSIVRASIKPDGIETEIPIGIATVKQWAEISLKTTESSIPQCIYPEGTNPLETVNVWPVPSGAPTLVLYSMKPLQYFDSVSETVVLPGEYEEAIEYNLAMRLAPKFAKSLSTEAMMIAVESLANVKRQNFKPSYLKSDVSGIFGTRKSNSFDYRTGD